LKLAKNILANYIGTGWVAFLSFALVPIYLRILGAEAYGLLSLMLAFRSILFTLDLGLGSVTSREIAFRAAKPHEKTLGSLIKTVEIAYWGLALISGAFFIFFFIFFGDNLLNSIYLSKSDIQKTLLLFSLVVITSFPNMFYRSVFRGLEKYVTYNKVLIAAVTIRGIGSLLVLLYISESIIVFVTWQAISTVLETCLLFFFMRRELSRCTDVKQHVFTLSELLHLFRFSFVVGAASLLGIAIIQADKVVISQFMTLEYVGYYSAAVVLVMTMGKITTPIVTAVFPRLTAMYSENHPNELRNIYIGASDLINFLIAPIGILFILFSADILQFWLGHSDPARETSMTLSILSLSYAIYSMTDLLVILTIVAKKPNILFASRFFALCFLLPLLWIVIPIIGLLGAAISVCIVLLFLFIVLNFNARILGTESLLDTTVRILRHFKYLAICLVGLGGPVCLIKNLDVELLFQIILASTLVIGYYSMGGMITYKKHKDIFVKKSI